jgi:hypothetical protein
MADIGTSVGLQGIYQGDSAQNSPAYKKPDTFKFGDMLVEEADRQEKKKQAEQDAFNKQLNPFISFDGSKYLIERVPLVQEQSQRLLQEALSAKRQGGNVMFNPNVVKELTKLQELQNKYGQEAATVRNFEKNILNSERANAYTDDAKEYTRKLLEGRSGIDKDDIITSKFYDDRQTYATYRDGEKRAKHLQYKSPDANKEVSVTEMIDGNYVTKKVKGSEIYDTPAGQESQRAVFEEILKTSTNPYDLGYLQEAQENIDLMMKEDDVFAENFKDMTELEAQGYKVREASKLMLRDAINSNKKTTVDKTTKVGTGFQFNNNFQTTAGGGAKGKVYNVEPAPIQPMYPAGKDGKPQMDKDVLVKKPKYFSIQSVAQGENAPKVVLGKYKGASVQGVVRDEDTGKVMFAKIAIPEKKTQGFVLKGDEARSSFVPIDDADINDIRTNIGADQYDASIGKWEKPKQTKSAPKKEAAKKVTKEEVKNKLSGF